MADKTKVTRIKSAPSKPKKEANFFSKAGKSIVEYFVGAWTELRQVRWPTRRATWGLVLAVIIFSAFFTALILLLDTLFKYMFEIIIT